MRKTPLPAKICANAKCALSFVPKKVQQRHCSPRCAKYAMRMGNPKFIGRKRLTMSWSEKGS